MGTWVCDKTFQSNDFDALPRFAHIIAKYDAKDFRVLLKQL